ncbi:MAG TPA: MIP/aquaporin family protein [Burkholderiales bacterium]|nr:MIP/aquaporin family protein [Burkholderiales bacterium]HYA46723.1 MIP/aquaporin family protein [Burkholderiales bacterium]
MSLNVRALWAEFLGTAGLLAVVVGSGIMAQRLALGNDALALLANAIVTGFGLYILISILAPISGAHFNPAVTLVAAIAGGFVWKRVPGYLVAQLSGAIAGVFLAHVMFDLPILQLGTHARAGTGQFVSEAVATCGLLLTIIGFTRSAPSQTAAAVGAYIAGAYWFTASTSFANPAVTVARALTNTFAGIRPQDAPAFILAQLAGSVAAVLLARSLGLRAGSPTA